MWAKVSLLKLWKDLTGSERDIQQIPLLLHTDLVTDLDFSPFDDFLLASGSADRMVSGPGWGSCL